MPKILRTDDASKVVVVEFTYTELKSPAGTATKPVYIDEEIQSSKDWGAKKPEQIADLIALYIRNNPMLISLTANANGPWVAKKVVELHQVVFPDGMTAGPKEG